MAWIDVHPCVDFCPVPGVFKTLARKRHKGKQTWIVPYLFTALAYLAHVVRCNVPRPGWSLAPEGPRSTSEFLVAVFLLGFLQEWVLRRLWRPKGWWVIATTAGLVGGWLLAICYTLLDLYIAQNVLLDSLFGYSIMGASVGMFQGFVLKRWVRQPELWVLVNMSSWLTAWVVSRLIIFSSVVRVEDWTEFLVFGLVVGTATGLLLIWLLRFPHPDPSHSEVTHASNHP